MKNLSSHESAWPFINRQRECQRFHNDFGSLPICMCDAVRYCVGSLLLQSGLTWIVLVERTKGSLMSMGECAEHERCNVPQTEGFSVPPCHAAVGPGHPSIPSAPVQPQWAQHCKLFMQCVDVLIELPRVYRIEMCQLTYISLLFAGGPWHRRRKRNNECEVFFFGGKVVSSVLHVSRTLVILEHCGMGFCRTKALFWITRTIFANLCY